MTKKYKFVRYNPEFKRLFIREKAKLKKILKNPLIEHIGSTAVPGLGGKGIIDIAILTPKKNLKKYLNILEKNKFEYKPRPGDNQRKFMQKIIKSSGRERRIHVHLTLNGSFWDSFINLRDYLGENKEAKKEYANLKKRAVKFAKGDGKKYHQYKQKFLQNLAEKANNWKKNKS